MDILEILREIERFKSDAPPDTYLVFGKRYGVRGALWAEALICSSHLFPYAYKDNCGTFSEWSTAEHVAKWFEEV